MFRNSSAERHYLWMFGLRVLPLEVKMFLEANTSLKICVLTTVRTIDLDQREAQRRSGGSIDR